ncbi:EAL domain-containing protein [Aliiglaciecola sp. CAU 1673]|uniref:sensor domain-containing protein n=1 Tax=Aliiglaciecola sp. CAU 1673 TaxID=3032595 RepID=UPI0023DA4D84|nr:EAL domain-containing protein [Aliiglaciecola sp. CAU 1673]MDF2176964.1 EAL domain-containing protein [Aliiglaciecola sp. CAU 1673]
MQTADLHTLLDALPDALVVVNDSGYIEWVSENVSALLGYSKSELVGQALDALVPDEFREPHRGFMKDFFSKPRKRVMSPNRSLPILCKSGKQIHVHIQLSPVRWQKKHGVLAIIRKETFPPAYERTFEEVKSLFDESQAIAKIGAWDWNVETGALHWSDQIFSIFGVDKEHFGASYEAFLQFVHPEDRENVVQAVNSALTYDVPYFVQHRIIRQDKTTRYVVERAKIYRDTVGTPIRMIGTVQDVTDEYHHQIQLKLADSVFKHAYDGAVSTDHELKILRVNPAFERISGYNNETLYGMPLGQIVPALREGDILNQVMRDGHWRGSLNCVRENQQTFPAHLSIAKVEDELDRDTKHFVITLTDISSIKLYEQQLKKLSIYDPLTSLFNRSYFIEKTTEIIEADKAEKGAFAIFFVDIDSFKEINDTQGHAEGDRILLLISQLLTEALGDSALISRFGGDDFVILYKSGDIDDIEEQASQILNALSLSREYGAYRYKITASVGIALYPHDGKTAQDLIKMADMAMYKAKESGKNRFLFYQDDFSREKAYRRQLISDLERGINENQLDVFYQPKVPCRYSEQAHFEALVRWKHPELGLVSPLDFIPVAEETGLIVNVGESVLRKVCDFLKHWHAKKKHSVTVSINLSPVQLFDRNLLDRILETVGPDFEHFDCLEFEITESAIIHNVESATTVLKSLRNLGCAISIDDFGTGYSSLSYLSRLPLDTVKIDKSFVRSLPANQEDSSICKAIISLGHSLKLNVVAEGIETQEQYWHLHAMGCDYIQGYLFGKPMAADDLLTYIQSDNYLNLVKNLTSKK